MANHNFRLDICPSFALVDQLKFQAEQAYYPMLILQDNSLWWVKLDLVLTSSAALVALKTQACMVVFGSTKLLWLHQKFSRFKKDRNGKKIIIINLWSYLSIYGLQRLKQTAHLLFLHEAFCVIMDVSLLKK